MPVAACGDEEGKPQVAARPSLKEEGVPRMLKCVPGDSGSCRGCSPHPPPFFFEHRQSFSCLQFLVTIAQFEIHYWVAFALSWSQTVLKDFWNLVILMFCIWCRLN